MFEKAEEILYVPSLKASSGLFGQPRPLRPRLLSFFSCHFLDCLLLELLSQSNGQSNATRSLRGSPQRHV